jgi:rubredoxin
MDSTTNKRIQCPDCSSARLGISGYGDHYSNMNPLQCLQCGWLFQPREGTVSEQPGGNLHRLAWNLYRFNKNKGLHLLMDLTSLDKKTAKSILEGLTLQDVRTLPQE